MATTFTLLQKITVTASAGAASVTFSNIPQTYTDLKIIFSGRTTRAAVADGYDISCNGLTTGFNARWFDTTGSGASVGADTRFTGDVPGASATANTFSATELYIPGYSSSTTSKQIMTDSAAPNNAAGPNTFANWTANSWNNTAAITSITLNSHNGNVTQNSTFYLYGISATAATSPIRPKATGGNTIAYDGTYWYHAFINSGTFTPKATLSCDVLVVAGGGGGGNNSAGGGGAGGVFYATAKTIATAQTVIVGAGGGLATNGSNSIFASLTAAVGGGRGGQSSTGYAGGSGGGGAGYVGTGTIAGGSSTQTGTGGTGYGNAGGSGADTDGRGGGGGGAGAVGGNSSGTNAAAGGAGNNTWSSWLSATGLGVSGYIAGGGGGGAVTNYGAGGSGGGGQGGNRSQIPTNGVANTGGGGGGVSDMANAGGQGLGGSGLIVVRYAG